MDYKEGFIKDLATSKLVDNRKPEEKIRQEYEKILHEDYDYNFEQMDIEVSIQRGEKNSSKNKSERADIVIYKTNDKNKREQNKDILGIIELKRPTRREGVNQLMSYMSATSCQWGVWTNGTEIEYIYRDISSGEIKRDFVYQIPRRGEDFEDIGKLSKNKLKPAKNLKPIFRRLLNTLYANTTISRKEKLGSEMIRLIFCKIWDEKYNQNALPQFRVGFNEKPEQVKKRIKDLFAEVKEELQEDGVFDKNEDINLDAKSVAYVVGELEQYSLLRTDKDVVGDAFEAFAESKLVGEKGEFFTPREVVKTAIQIVNPQPQQTILDPACGSGGFLIYALEHVWKIMETSKKYKDSPQLEKLKKEVAEKYFHGIDKETDLVKIAKAYMAIIGDGRSRIVQENTLRDANEYQTKPKELFVNENGGFNQFDIVMTNPPFGSKTKVAEDDSKSFDLGHIWTKQDNTFVKTNKTKETKPQVLFIERCLAMLKSGGKLAIVLPETYFHAPSERYVLNYLLKNNNVLAIIDLAHNTFRPYCNAKTCLIVIEKDKEQQENITMAVTEEIGHDHTGKEIFRYDATKKSFTNIIWDDTIIVREELKEPSNKDNSNVFVVKSSEIKDSIYVPRYYWKKRITNIVREAEKSGYILVKMNDLIKNKTIMSSSGHGSPPSEYKGIGEVPYVRVADIVNWEVYKNPTASIPKHIYDMIKGKSGLEMKEKDILFVRRGSYRIGSVALVSKFDTDVLLTKEIQTFRVINEKNIYDIDAFYLLYLLSHELTQKQLYNKVFIDTTLPNIGDRWKELYLPVSKDKDERIKIKEKIKQTFSRKWGAVEDIDNLKKEFGNLTT